MDEWTNESERRPHLANHLMIDLFAVTLLVVQLQRKDNARLLESNVLWSCHRSAVCVKKPSM